MAENEKLEIVIDADRINIEGYLEFIEIQERLNGNPTASNLRDMLRVLEPAIVSPPLSDIPARYIRHIFATVSESLTAGMDPN